MNLLFPWRNICFVTLEVVEVVVEVGEVVEVVEEKCLCCRVNQRASAVYQPPSLSSQVCAGTNIN